MEIESCKICGSEVKEPSHFWKEHRLKQADYYLQNFPKQDLYTKESLIFKTKEQYFSADFNNRDNLKSYLNNLPKQEIKSYCVDLFKKRKEYRNLIYSPTQVELRSVISPPVNFINKYFDEGYLKFCKSLGFVNRFTYDTSFSIKINPNAQNCDILVDSREQKYLDLDHNTSISTLNYGDYRLSDFDLGGRIVVERKSLPDFIGTFGKNVQRFENEVVRAAEDNGYILVIVEEELIKALKFNTLKYVSKKIRVSPDFIFHNVRELLQKYTNLQFIFVKNRAESARILKKALFSNGVFKQFDVQMATDLQLI